MNIHWFYSCTVGSVLRNPSRLQGTSFVSWSQRVTQLLFLRYFAQSERRCWKSPGAVHLGRRSQAHESRGSPYSCLTFGASLLCLRRLLMWNANPQLGWADEEEIKGGIAQWAASLHTYLCQLNAGLQSVLAGVSWWGPGPPTTLSSRFGLSKKVSFDLVVN